MNDDIAREALPSANMNDNDYADGWNECLEAIYALPAADVRPNVTARWSDVSVDFSDDKDLQIVSMFCDNCHRWHNEVYHYGNPIEFAKFCSFCGAKMEVDK